MDYQMVIIWTLINIGLYVFAVTLAKYSNRKWEKEYHKPLYKNEYRPGSAIILLVIWFMGIGLMYAGSENPYMQITVDEINIWSEVRGFLGSSTSWYAKINDEHVLSIDNPYEIQQGEIVDICRTNLGSIVICNGG